MIKNPADIMNEYFVNVTKNLDIPEFKIEQLPMNTNIVCIDPIDHILFKTDLEIKSKEICWI